MDIKRRGPYWLGGLIQAILIDYHQLSLTRPPSPSDTNRFLPLVGILRTSSSVMSPDFLQRFTNLSRMVYAAGTSMAISGMKSYTRSNPYNKSGKSFDRVGRVALKKLPRSEFYNDY